jgi:hypothetical protein
MKKRILSIFIIILAIGLTACSQQKNNNENNEKEKQTKKVNLQKVDEVVTFFKEKGLPIAETKKYTEEDDPNELLGRPGQYIGKVNFIDTNVVSKKVEDEKKEFGPDATSEEEIKKGMLKDFEVDSGGSFEVFKTDTEAKKRFDYLSKITKELGGALTEYDYVQKNVLLRLSHSLTPQQAANYEKVLNELAE